MVCRPNTYTIFTTIHKFKHPYQGKYFFLRDKCHIPLIWNDSPLPVSPNYGRKTIKTTPPVYIFLTTIATVVAILEPIKRLLYVPQIVDTVWGMILVWLMNKDYSDVKPLGLTSRVRNMRTNCLIFSRSNLLLFINIQGACFIKKLSAADSKIIV